MKRVFLILTILLALSPLCLLHSRPSPIPSIYDAQFNEEVESFVANAAANGITVDLSGLTIRVSNLFDGTNILGVCIPTQKTVLMNQGFWDKADGAEREFLVWHELGHCLIGRNHDTWVHDNYPVSIMFPIEWATGREAYWYQHRNELIYELFHPFMSSLYEIDPASPQGMQIVIDYFR